MVQGSRIRFGAFAHALSVQMYILTYINYDVVYDVYKIEYCLSTKVAIDPCSGTDTNKNSQETLSLNSRFGRYAVAIDQAVESDFKHLSPFGTFW